MPFLSHPNTHSAQSSSHNSFEAPQTSSIKSKSSLDSMFRISLSREKPLPKPYYYNRMNPEEMQVWEIIGETKYEWVRDRKGKLHKRRLTPKDRARLQRMFYDTRVGHGVCGDEWMRKQLPCRKAP